MMTNLEYIRQMNIDELAEWVLCIQDIVSQKGKMLCLSGVKSWLEQES